MSSCFHTSDNHGLCALCGMPMADIGATWRIAALDDNGEEHLFSRRFDDLGDALKYKATIAANRKPIILVERY